MSLPGDKGQDVYYGWVEGETRIAAACSFIGQSHLDFGDRRDDSFHIAVKDKLLIACIADGAGSAISGGVGARTAARLVTEELLLTVTEGMEFDHAALESIIVTAINGVRANLALTDRPLSDYHSTLQGVITTTNSVAVFHIGDGAVGCFRQAQDDSWQTIAFSAPESGEHANETVFFTQDEWRRHLRLMIAKDVDAVLMMTDGVTPFGTERGSQDADMIFVAPILDILSRHPAATGQLILHNLLAREDVRRGCEDDKTILWIGNKSAVSNARAV